MKEEQEGRIESNMSRCIRMLAPGTVLYEGLESILRARTGALIVIGDTEEVMRLVDGGFRIDSEIRPASLYELAKMDGALILTRDAKRILYANAHLNPDPMIPSVETGIRHRTAERVAIQTGQLVIAISQRRNVITLYYGHAKYILRDVSVVLAQANQALNTLEKYRNVLEQSLFTLTSLEFEDLATVFEATAAIQRAQMVARIAAEIETYICELGDEGRLVEMQLNELMVDIEGEGLLVIRDYISPQAGLKPEALWRQLTAWPSEELLEQELIAKALGLAHLGMEGMLTPRGYRVLARIPRLPVPVIENLVNRFGTLAKIMEASIDELDDVEGIGEVRARTIKEGLLRLREQTLVDRHM